LLCFNLFSLFHNQRKAVAAVGEKGEKV